jgi:hypothetical protein
VKADEENAADEQNRAEHGDDDVMPHAERNLRDVRRAPRHEDFERTAVPTFGGRRAEGVHFLHQFLAIERADRWLIRDDKEHAQRAVRRSERLIVARRGARCERLQRGRDHSQRVER